MEAINFVRWVDNLSTFREVILFIISTFVFLSWIASVIARSIKTSPPTEYLLNLLNIASGGLFILIIFVTLNVWQYCQTATQHTIIEAAALTNMLTAANHFDNPASPKLIPAIKNYIIAVRTNEWNAMRDGHMSEAAFKKLLYLNQLILNLNPPNTDNNSLFYSQLLNNLEIATTCRYQRLDTLNSVVPYGLRRAIVMGCLFIVVLLGALSDKRSLLPVIVFDIILAFNLSLALIMDYPFSGEDTSVTNRAFYSGALKFIPDTYLPIS